MCKTKDLGRELLSKWGAGDVLMVKGVNFLQVLMVKGVDFLHVSFELRQNWHWAWGEWIVCWFTDDNLLKLLFSDGTWQPVGSECMVLCNVSPSYGWSVLKDMFWVFLARIWVIHSNVTISKNQIIVLIEFASYCRK